MTKDTSDGENHALIDLMEDYYDILIENAILKERLKQKINQVTKIELQFRHL